VTDEAEPLGVQPFITPRGLGLAILSAAVGAFAVLTGQQPTAVLAAALLAWVTVGVLLHRWPDLRVAASLTDDRVVEGDVVDLVVDIESTTSIPWLEVEVVTPDDLPVVGGVPSAIVALPAGRWAAIRFELSAEQWGVSSPSRLRITTRDRMGIYAARRVVTLDLPLRVHPSDRRMDAMIQSTRTRARVGHHLARQRGDGCEYADVRPAKAGDRLRSVNWRVTLRRSEYWVSDRHPDQASDLVLFVDSGQALGRGSNSTIHTAVRAALALTEGHLGTHDRVGLLDVGRRVRWFRPGMGRLQRRRLVDALLEIRPELGLGVRKASDLPLQGVDTGATIVVLSPLLDPRPIDVMLSLHDRGYDLVVLWCQPDIEAIRPAEGRNAELARRLWNIQREQWRRRLTSAGVPVVAWNGDGSLEAAMTVLDHQRRTRVG